jgi:flagellar motor protein MotB
VPADSLTTLGQGEADPLVPNDSPENKAKNRRIELIVQET